MTEEREDEDLDRQVDDFVAAELAELNTCRSKAGLDEDENENETEAEDDPSDEETNAWWVEWARRLFPNGTDLSINEIELAVVDATLARVRAMADEKIEKQVRWPLISYEEA